MNTSWWRRLEALLRTLYALFPGQVVSFMYAICSFTSSYIADLGVDAPLAQNACTHVLLVLVSETTGRRIGYSTAETNFVDLYYFFYFSAAQGRVSWYWYLILGFVDVQGSFLINQAYQYSSITSVTLLDCWVIVWVILLTWVFLRTRYSLLQLLGAAICILALGLVLLSDAGVSGGGGSRPLLGDFLVILGTIFVALSNVGEEFCVKKKDRVEVVAMIGIFGLLVSICEISILEIKNLKSIEWSTDIILSLFGFAMSTFLLYTLVPFLLQISGAAMLNLSALTTDMWAVVIRIFFYQQKVDWLYYLSLAIVGVGLVIYSMHEKVPAPLPAPGDDNQSAEYQVLREEDSEPRNGTSDP